MAGEHIAFREFRSRMIRLYFQGRYQEALAVARKARERFPEKRGQTSYWIACLACRLSDPDQALLTLEEALEEGHWWGEHWLLEDPDLAPLRERPEFQRILKICLRRQKSAQQEAKPQLQVLAPKRSSERSPLLMALHWLGGTVEEFAPYWKAAPELGYLVAIPQSSQIVSENSYVWNDFPLARREIAGHWERLQREYRVDLEKVIIAGASQGGRLAVELALVGEPIPAQGFIAVAPAIRDYEGLLEAAAGAAKRGVRGWVLVGEHDHFRPAMEAFCDQARAAGLECELEVVPELRHEFPDDFPSRLPRALSWISRG